MTQITEANIEPGVTTSPATVEDIKGLLFDQFPVLADAHQSVPRMRELILQLAVRGKLVPQDSNDEPASELLKKITAEKARLIKEGKIKKQKPLDPIDQDELSYGLPGGWEWVRLGDTGFTQTGNTPPTNNPQNVGDHIPFITPGDIQHPQIDYNQRGLSEIGLSRGRLIPAGSVMMVCIGGSIGKANLTNSDVSCNQQINVITPYHPLNGRWILISLWTPYFQKIVIDKAGTGTLPILSKSKWERIPVGVPPLAEQRRIVAKVDQLMSLCDELEARQEERNQGRVRLNKTALHSLTEAQEPEAFITHWNRIHSHFDLLYDTPETVPDLRQAILQLAVRGKLVPQDPGDEPASELLKKIAAEKARLVAEGKTKKQKPLPPIDPDEVPYDLPGGWKWVRYGEVVLRSQTGPFGTQLHKRDYVNGGYPIVNPSNLRNNKITPDPNKAVADSVRKRLPRYVLANGDVVLARRGEMGRAVKVTDQEDGWFCGTGSMFFRLPGDVDADFLVLLLTSSMCREYLMGTSVGMTMNNLSDSILQAMPVVLPPLPEQQRIVAKVDQLMSLCDELKAKFGAAQAVQGRLLDAVVDQVVNGGDQTG